MWSRIAALVTRRRLDRDLDDEVAFHLQMLVDGFVERGMSPDEARRRALREFGGVVQMKEAYREQRSLPWLETILQDARYGVRTLAGAPGFTLAALVTLALGIGANTAIFSVVNAVLLRPLPFPEPGRLVQMVWRNAGDEISRHTGVRYLFFRDHAKAVEALAAWRNPTSFNLATGTSAEFVRAMPVSKEYFQVFGVQPAYGSAFDAEHDRAGGPNAAVLGHALWMRMFGGNPAVIGTSIALGDRPFTVVGVMPRGFASIPPVDLYVPLRPGTTGAGGGTNYFVAGRVRRELTPAQAGAEATALFEAFKEAHPDAVAPRDTAAGFVEFQSSMARSARGPLLIMLGAVGMLLLIACANTANLLLARASGRGREIAVRVALGAARGRVIRQLLTESVILFVTGGAAGIALAYWTVPALLALTPSSYTVYQDVSIDGRVLAAMLGVSVVTGLVFGLAPALSLTRTDLVETFKNDGTRTTASVRSGWVRRTLVVAEVALCMLLLVGAGLLIQTFVKMRAIDPGFDAHNLLTARMSLQGDRYKTTADFNRFFDEALGRIRRIPGVRAAAVVNGIPIENALNLNVDVTDLEGPTKIERALTDWRYASTNYFEAMGIPIVAGRGFVDEDRAGAPPVAVVSEYFASRYLKGVNPIGHHLKVFDSDAPIEIVGVARDLKEGTLRGRRVTVMYVPITQANIAGVRITHTYFPMSWVVRADTVGPQLAAAMREEVRSVDPRQPFSSFSTMEDVKAGSMRDETFQMTLLTILAGLGLALAMAGIYGIVSYSVAQHTREFGIRMALGAPRGRILGAVVRQGAVLGVAGVVVGAGMAAGLTRLLGDFVYGVSTLDVSTFGLVGVTLIVVAVLASLIPALRAVRLDPVSALRE